MVNYSQSIIYKICCRNPDIKEIYIGSTTNFYRRKQQHKNRCNNSNDKSYNLNVYKFIRANGNWDNWDMIIIEKFECNDKLELHKQERYILEQLGASLNSNIPNRSSKEYREKNKEKKKEYLKEYYENNKEKNKQKNKEYYEKNKEEINKKMKEKVECDICNKVMNRGNLNRHNKKLHN